MEELILKVEKWAEDRNLITGGTPLSQAMKTLEEVNELIEAIKEDDRVEIEDAIGDIIVTLIIQARIQRMDFIGCVENAYEVIKNRKGKLINGTFVKDA